MKLNAQVTLDLPGSDSKVRDLFYKSLMESQWKKDANVTTTWRIYFTEAATYAGILTALKRPVFSVDSGKH